MTGARIVNAKTALLKHCGLLFASDGSLQQILTGEPNTYTSNSAARFGIVTGRR